MKSSSLSKRGFALLPQGESNFDIYVKALQDQYHPETNKDGYIIAGIAENKLLYQHILDSLTKSLGIAPCDLCYPSPIGNDCFRKALLSVLQSHVKKELDYKKIIASAGVTSSLINILSVLCDPGDSVLVQTPCYGSFKKDIEDVPMAKFVGVETLSSSNFKMTVEDLEKTYNEEVGKYNHVSCLIICTPHNPLGRILPNEDLVKYIEWAREKKIHVIVDEIYAGSIISGEFTSAIDIVEEMKKNAKSAEEESFLTNYVHIVNGLSKDFGMSGIRVGYVYTENEEALGALTSNALPYMIPTTIQTMITNLLKDEKWLIDYKKNYKTQLQTISQKVKDFFTENNIPYVDFDSGIFVTINLTHLIESLAEEKKATQLFLKNKLFINSGESFFFKEPGFFRLVYTDFRTIDESMRRIKATVEEIKEMKK